MFSRILGMLCLGEVEDDEPFPIYVDAYGFYVLEEDEDEPLFPIDGDDYGFHGLDLEDVCMGYSVTTFPKLDQGSTSSSQDENEIEDADMETEKPNASDNEKTDSDKKIFGPTMRAVLITPQLLSKKKLLFEQCSIGRKDTCNISLLDDLLKEIGSNVRNESGETPLTVALKKISKGVNYDVFETLMKNGADAMIKYKVGRGLLADLIFYYGDQRVISSYIPYHRDINAALNNFDETALNILTFRKGINLVKSLLKRGACPNTRDKSGKTTLHIAVERRSPKMVEVLLGYRADIDAQCKEGMTPLHYACGMVDKGCIDLLLKHKCQVNLHDARNRTPLYYFIKYPCNHDSLLEKLINAGCQIKGASKGFKPLHMLATEGIFKKNAVKYVDVLVRRGVDVNDTNGRAHTALHLAARFSTEEFAKCLLDHGANYNAFTSKCVTALDIALRWGHNDVAVQIVKAASVDRHQRKTIARRILNKMESNNTLNVYHQDFRSELIKLSGGKGGVSYLDIYRANWNTLMDYTKDNKVVNYVENLKSDKYPLYGKEIKKKFQDALKRRLAVEGALDPLYWLFQEKLPFLCIKHLTQYLSTEDLEKLNRVKIR